MKIGNYDIKGKRFLLFSGALAGVITGIYMATSNQDANKIDRSDIGEREVDEERVVDEDDDESSIDISGFYTPPSEEGADSSDSEEVNDISEENKENNYFDKFPWEELTVDQKVERIKRRYNSLPDEGQSQIDEYLLGDIVANEGEKFATNAKNVLDYGVSRLEGFFETSSSYQKEKNISQLEQFIGGEK